MGQSVSPAPCRCSTACVFLSSRLSDASAWSTQEKRSARRKRSPTTTPRLRHSWRPQLPPLRAARIPTSRVRAPNRFGMSSSTSRPVARWVSACRASLEG